MTCTKRSYATQAEADEALGRAIAQAKRTRRGGTSYKRLNVYRCQQCGLFHLGRGNKLVVHKPAPAPKPPTPGQQRRQQARQSAQAARQAFFADYRQTLEFCRILIDREIARYEALGIPKRKVVQEAERD